MGKDAKITNFVLYYSKAEILHYTRRINAIQMQDIHYKNHCIKDVTNSLTLSADIQCLVSKDNTRSTSHLYNCKEQAIVKPRNQNYKIFFFLLFFFFQVLTTFPISNAEKICSGYILMKTQSYHFSTLKIEYLDNPLYSWINLWYRKTLTTWAASYNHM